MSVTLKSNDSIFGYIINVSNENKKTKFYVKFTMQSKNDQLIDGWVFGNTSGILSTPLGMALTNSLKNQSGLRLWGKLQEEKGMLVFKTQSWSKFQQANPDFLFQATRNNIVLIRDALMSTEPCSIRAFIINIGPAVDFRKNGINHTNTFILIGDSTGTTYLSVIDLTENTIQSEQTFDFTQIRRKIFNGVPILTTTINTHITSSATPVDADISDVAITLSMDLSDKKTIISSIEEIGTITRSTGCATCKGDLIDVTGAAALAYCSKCQRHSLKKNHGQDYSTTFIIKNNEEKIFLSAQGQILEQFFSLAGVSATANDKEIAMILLSSGNFCFEYSEFQKDLIAVSKVK